MTFTKQQVNTLLDQVIVGRITSITPHENADRLQIIHISVGDYLKELIDIAENDTIQIVTAAQNIHEGDLVPYAPPGTTVPGVMLQEQKEFVLESRAMRGEISHGMILAEDELGVGTDHEGIMLLPRDTMVGQSMTKVLSATQMQEAYSNAGIIDVPEEIVSAFNLIVKNLEEYQGAEDLIKILQERDLKIYYGTAPTGQLHFGHIVPIIKIGDFLSAGCEVTILLADIHAYLDNMKSDWELLEYRTQYYEIMIRALLDRVGVPQDKLKFITGRDYQLDAKYTMDVYRLTAITSLRDAKKAGAEVVKQVESPLLSGMLYPLLQALDEEYLGVDAQLGGLDQRKIFMHARTYLPKLGYKKRIHFMTPLIPGLGKSGKMSSSDPSSKVEFTDSDEMIRQKIQKAFSVDKQVEGNGLLALLKYILFHQLEKEDRAFIVERPDKWGGNISYDAYESLEQDFAAGTLSSVDLKPAVAQEIIAFIAPVREMLNQEKDLMSKAYPEE